MSAPEEEERGQEAPLVGFIFGNVDENNRVEADYLDEEAKEHLSGLARVQGGALELQAELQAEGDQSAGDSGVLGAAVQPAADAKDFADEAELIEDAEAAAAAAAAAAAERQRQLGVVGAALQVGAAAEDEDYDFDGDDAAPVPAPTAAAPVRVPAPLAPAPLAPPQLLATPAAPLAAPAAPPPLPPGVTAPQLVAAHQRHVRLPVLGRSIDGETVLRFSELYGYQGVMAGHVQTVDELRPPQLLPRGRRRGSATQRQRALPAPADAAEVEGEDEEALMHAADLEVLEEEDEEEQEDKGEPELAQQRGMQDAAAPVPAAAAQAQTGGSAQQRARGARQPPREQAKQPHPALVDDGEEADEEGSPPVTGGTVARPRQAGSGGARPSALTFQPVDILEWEKRVHWRGADDGGGVESEHETDDEQDAAGAAGAAGTAAGDGAWQGGDQQAYAGAFEQQQAAFGGVDVAPQPWGEMIGAQQQQADAAATQPIAPADIAAMFAQQQPALGAWPAQVAAAPAVPPLQQQQQFGASAAAPPAAAVHVTPDEELPGLTSAHAAELQARAAAESDEEDYFSLPTAPLLRLELLSLCGLADEDGGRRRLHAAPNMLAVHRETWEDRIAWDGRSDTHKFRLGGAVYDLNDASQAFELTQQVPAGAAGAGRQLGGPADVAALVSQAASLILQPQAAALPLPPRGSGFDPNNPEEVELWRLQQGLAREREYHQLAKRKAGTGTTVRVLHAKLAIDLATIPILNPTPHNQEEINALALWHTPRGKWWPLEVSRVTVNVGGGKKGKGGAAGPVNLTIASLAGLSKSFQAVALDSRLQDLWKHLLENIALFKPAERMRPLMLLPGRPPAALPLDQPLSATGAVKQGQKQVKLTVAFQEVELLPTPVIAAVPSGDNPALLRPPNAFTRKRDFSAGEPGHVVLLEYMEQQPPLLNRPGMGAKLVTYYRKQKADDTGHQKIKQDAQGRRWRVGAVQPLGDDDDSPFLGQLPKGGSSLSVETGLYRSIAFPYEPPHTDFLLLRSPAGTMQLRELTGTVVVGQQLPMLRVPAPTAREVKDLEERRIYVYVFKHLRRQQAKLDKDPAKQGQQASITLKALAEAFPSRPPTMIRAYLKDTGELAVRPVGDTEVFSLKEGARPPSEAELRKKLTPEETCALEACYVAAFRMKQRGLLMHEKLDKAAIEKLRLAAEMLPPDDSFQKAARLVEQAMQSAPWTLTDAFVTHFREGKAQLQLAGAADPTGRGFGYSFVRDVRHKHANADDVTKQMAKRQAGKVQGTDADLRRMTTAQAKDRLRSYGLTDEDIAGMGRWTMIDMVRQLASAAAQDGTVDAAAVKFVRHQKTTLIELQRRAAERAQQILEKQMAVLNNTAAEDLGDQEALEAELERELAAAEAAEEGGGPAPTPLGKKGKRDGSPAPDDEQRMMQQMRAEGLMAGSGGAAGADGAAAAPAPAPALPAGSGGPPPKDGPGTRRIRREVFLKAADGTWQKSHEIVYVGRDRPGQLHSLYQKEGTGNYPFGFGTRTIAGRPKELRLSYAAARGRGIGRSAPRGGGGGRGRGRGKKAAASLEDASPEVARARQSSRQRKTRQFDDIFDGDESLSDDDDLDFEYNEEAEAPYFAVPAEQEPKKKKQKKQKKEAAEGEGGQAGAAGEAGEEGAAGLAAQAPAEAMPALPDDFAAALAAATMVRAPAAPPAEAEPVKQEQVKAEGPEELAPPAISAGAPSQGAGSAGAAPAAPSQPEAALPVPVAAEQQQQQQQAPVEALPPQDVQQPALQPQLSKPKFKIKLGVSAPAAAPQPPPPREPSPDYVYDYTVGDEEEDEEAQAGRRKGKANDDEDYEAPAEEGSEDEFVPNEAEVSEEELEERRYMAKARRSRNYESLGRSTSRRSGGGARSRGGGGGKKTSGGATRKGGVGGGSGGGGGGRRKRSRADFDDEELEEEEEEEVDISDDDATLDDEEDGADLSDDAGTTPAARGGRQRGAPAGAVGGVMAPAGQLGERGRHLGAILGGIVQQLRSIKKEFGFPPKMTKVYELVFGKVPSLKHAPDYHSFVPKAQVIILPELQKKAKAGRYLDVNQFRQDLQQLYQNAVTYNTPGNGNFGDPYFIQVAKDLLDDAEGLIAQHLHEIEAAEAGQQFGAYQQQQLGFGAPQPPPFF